MFDIHEPSQVGAARRYLGERARAHGFDQALIDRLSLAVTEAGTNLVKHAREGMLLARPLGSPENRGIEVLAIDRGPGMPDIAASSIDGVSTSGTMGTGLGAIARVSDHTQLYSMPGQGTVIRFVLGGDAVEGAPIEMGVVNLPIQGEEVSGDGWRLRLDQERLLLMVCDGLGHGASAADATRAMQRVFDEQAAELSPMEITRSGHAAMRSTRGAATAIAECSFERNEILYSGVGNISGIVYADGRSRHLLSHPGIVGHQMSKLTTFNAPWPADSLLIMHSDGLGTHWSLDDYPGLTQQHPAVIAGALYRDHSRGRDDTTVVVLKRKAVRHA
ncbi:MAG TPA: ATP-binding protein [Burkholderiales bacterium]|nr:ATP-binding protein [Burkholderiales bacterium]